MDEEEVEGRGEVVAESEEKLGLDYAKEEKLGLD